MNEVADCIENNVEEVREDIVKMVSGVPVEADLSGYSAAEQELYTRDEILSAMVVYGFLSYHDNCLKIPNHELMEKFQRVLSRDSMGEVKDIIPRKRGIPAIVLELKVDDSAENAIRQIKDKKYVQRVESFGNVILTGISYDRKHKKHECIIEKISLID